MLHDSGTALFTMAIYLLDLFLKKRRSPLDPVSRRTLIVLCLTISLLLASSCGGWASFRCFLDQFRPNFFKLDPNLVFLALFLALIVIKLLPELPYKCITATYCGHFAHLSNFKSLFISPVIANWDSVHDFNRTGLRRLKIRQKWLIYFKTLIYYMLRVMAPSFLFGIEITC